MMRWCWLFLGAVLASPAWAGELPPVKLGLVIPMAGEAGRIGQSMRQAAEMAVADWTARLGRKVELVLGDDQFERQGAQARCRTVFGQEGSPIAVALDEQQTIRP